MTEFSEEQREEHYKDFVEHIGDIPQPANIDVEVVAKVSEVDIPDKVRGADKIDNGIIKANPWLVGRVISIFPHYADVNKAVSTYGSEYSKGGSNSITVTDDSATFYVLAEVCDETTYAIWKAEHPEIDDRARWCTTDVTLVFHVKYVGLSAGESALLNHNDILCLHNPYCPESPYRGVKGYIPAFKFNMEVLIQPEDEVPDLSTLAIKHEEDEEGDNATEEL